MTFETAVRTVVPLVETTEARKADLRRAIRGLRARGCTNLAGGLLERCAMASREPEPGLRARVLLLTDGQANEGPATDPDALVALVRDSARAASVSAFGYGNDCDQSLLAGMADAGGGSYAYIADDDAVMTAFARELGGLLATYGSDVRVRIRPAEGPPVEELLGDVLHHGELATVVRVHVAARDVSPAVEICEVEAAWKDVHLKERTASAVVRVDVVRPGDEIATDDPEVVRVRDERLLADAMDRAERKARSGDWPAAHHAVARAVDALADPDLVAFARDVLLPCYEGEAPYAVQSGVRAGSLAALKRKRQATIHALVADSLGIVADPAELAAERSFRSGSPSPKRRKRSKTSK